MGVLSQRQLYQEGNHRTGSLIASGILLKNGCPPFVLTRQNAVAYSNPSSEIRFADKRTIRDKLRLPKYQHAFRKFLQQNVNQAYVRESRHIGYCVSLSGTSTTKPPIKRLPARVGQFPESWFTARISQAAESVGKCWASFGGAGHRSQPRPVTDPGREDDFLVPGLGDSGLRWRLGDILFTSPVLQPARLSKSRADRSVRRVTRPARR